MRSPGWRIFFAAMTIVNGIAAVPIIWPHSPWLAIAIAAETVFICTVELGGRY